MDLSVNDLISLISHTFWSIVPVPKSNWLMLCLHIKQQNVILALHE